MAFAKLKGREQIAQLLAEHLNKPTSLTIQAKMSRKDPTVG